MSRHLSCLRWSLLAGVVGLAATAWGQEVAPASIASDPVTDALVRLVSGGGLPAVLAVIAWWARGQLGTGIPVRVELHPDDRALIKRLARALEREREPDSDEPRTGT